MIIVMNDQLEESLTGSKDKVLCGIESIQVGIYVSLQVQWATYQEFLAF